MIDDLRARHPALGYAVYALEPGGAVTLEIHDAGEVYTFLGETEVEAVAKAFPELMPVVGIPTAPEPETPVPSVFD